MILGVPNIYWYLGSVESRKLPQNKLFKRSVQLVNLDIWKFKLGAGLEIIFAKIDKI